MSARRIDLITPVSVDPRAQRGSMLGYIVEHLEATIVVCHQWGCGHRFTLAEGARASIRNHPHDCPRCGAECCKVAR
jgi:hypothetical protein